MLGNESWLAAKLFFFSKQYLIASGNTLIKGSQNPKNHFPQSTEAEQYRPGQYKELRASLRRNAYRRNRKGYQPKALKLLEQLIDITPGRAPIRTNDTLTAEPAVGIRAAHGSCCQTEAQKVAQEALCREQPRPAQGCCQHHGSAADASTPGPSYSSQEPDVPAGGAASTSQRGCPCPLAGTSWPLAAVLPKGQNMGSSFLTWLAQQSFLPTMCFLNLHSHTLHKLSRSDLQLLSSNFA